MERRIDDINLVFKSNFFCKFFCLRYIYYFLCKRSIGREIYIGDNKVYLMGRKIRVENFVFLLVGFIWYKNIIEFLLEKSYKVIRKEEVYKLDI